MQLLIAASLLTAAAVAYDNQAPNARLPTLGWSSWVGLGPAASDPVFDFCDEFSIRAAVDAFMEVGLYDAGYRHFHLDDCWASPSRNGSGFLQPDGYNFPNGMRPVVDYAHSRNLSFGLYTCAGTETCVGGRAGSKGHWEQDAQVFAEWGVDWVKQDWCNTDGMVPQEAYGNMSAAMNATGRPMAFNMCEWGVDNPWTWGNPIAQSWRMSGDHTAVWSSTKEIIAATAAIPAAFSGRPYGWNDMDMLETGCYEQCANGNNRRPNMTAGEYKTEFSMWAISASPLQITTRIMNCTQPPVPSGSLSLIKQTSIIPCIADVTYGLLPGNATMFTNNGCRGNFSCNGRVVTCDVDGAGLHACACSDAPVTCKGWLSDLQKEILLNTEIIAINQDVTPQGAPIKPGDLTVWARWLSDGSVGVAFYNEGDAPATISVAFADLGGSWGATTVAAARDLWAHADLGDFTGRYPAQGGVTVAPHETHMVRLSKTA